MRKRVYVVFFLMLLITAIFLHFEKRYLNPKIGYWSPPSQQAKPDSLLLHKAISQTNIKDYILPYQGEELVQYLLPKLTNGDELISHIGYTLAYNEYNEEADWVVYELTASEVHSQRKRTDNFKQDPDVKTGSATSLDYLHSGYDRGHLAPAADMKWSDQAMKESFYMSNMTPQEPDFNRGIWENLEEQVRNWAVSDQEIFVITGPVFYKPSSERNYIGANKVAVPDAFFKIILDEKPHDFKVIAFMIPNDGSYLSLWNFTTSISTVEKKTGLDFFPQLPDSIENMLEGTDYSNLWH
jgi:endonuclease G, mitochondrial